MMDMDMPRFVMICDWCVWRLNFLTAHHGTSDRDTESQTSTPEVNARQQREGGRAATGFSHAVVSESESILYEQLG